MPRPGTRSIECVRRNWHSDRHQPIRGSIIQQLFWVLHESHSPVTKKSEWQEKLPILVLKAEEIMYSKANSEAEYMDFQTLWERVNDAINIIMRRDESTETKDLLPPCVEACLNLSCVPVKASRSYLGPKPDEPVCSSSKITKNSSKNQNLQLPHRLVNQSNLNSPHLPTESKDHISPISTNVNNISPNSGTYFSNNHKKKPEPGFDLSLRLGLFKEPFVGPQKGQVIDINKESTSNDPSGFGTSRWSFEGEGHGAGPASKKRKVLFSINLKDEINFLEPQLMSERSAGQIKRPCL